MGMQAQKFNVDPSVFLVECRTPLVSRVGSIPTGLQKSKKGPLTSLGIPLKTTNNPLMGVGSLACTALRRKKD
jgi:hypothetical protein